LLKAHWIRAEEQGAELACKPSVNKQQEGQQRAGDRPLSEVGKEQRRKTTRPSPWAPTVRWLCSVEEQTANNHKMLTVAASRWITDLALAPGKGSEAKAQAPSKQAQS
jgi:hypothetical protein